MEIKNSILIEWREKIDNWMWKIYESGGKIENPTS